MDNNWNRDPTNVAFTTHLMNGRNELFPDPFDEFDPHHSIGGKKAFQVTKVRSLQTRIDIKGGYGEVLPKKPKPANNKPEVISEFDRKCNQTLNENKKHKRMCHLTHNNPFLEGNTPPKDHLIPDEILEKPGYIKNLS